MMKNLYPQILTFVSLIINCVSHYFMGMAGHYTSISGAKGFDYYWHYWYLFEYRIQILFLLLFIYLAIKYPLQGVYKKYGSVTLLLYLSLVVVEIMVYLWTGNDRLNESYYIYYVALYTSILMITANRMKIWKL